MLVISQDVDILVHNMIKNEIVWQKYLLGNYKFDSYFL